MTQTLLVELLTEELPPKALGRLGRAFGEALHADLARVGLIGERSEMTWFATPRRLAVQITHALEAAPDKAVEVQGPAVKVALDAAGNPTPALQGFARKNGIAVDALDQQETPKGRVFIYRGVSKGARLETGLDGRVASALQSLPIPRLMRWGEGESEFVRPVHGLVMMHGSTVIPGSVLGVQSGNSTQGHRFLSQGPLTIGRAADYEVVLRDKGCVIASFDERKAQISKALAAAADGATPLRDDALLDEVTALVENPSIYAGTFSPEFLEVPQECLVLSMKQHQKYFPLVDPVSGRLAPQFLMVSNLRTSEPHNIIRGNERVLRARLSDAKFFYEQDRKVRLEQRVPQLAQVVYHSKLGTVLQRVNRIEVLAERYARALQTDASLAQRAARLAKADLLTGMVGEFPELQGVMGRYYALHDGESDVVAQAIEAHYRPRYAGDDLPETQIACAVALADKLEALAGLFGIGQQPTGDKDPYALRRHALGVIRILSERNLRLDLSALVDDAFGVFVSDPELERSHTALLSFFFDRMRGYFGDAGYSPGEIDAVLALKPSRVDLIRKQLDAVRMFNTLPEAPSLAAANKRIGNILKKAARVPSEYSKEFLVEPAEKALAADFGAAKMKADAHYAAQDYAAMLQTLATLKGSVDAFFDGVMVMTEDVRLRENRVALLAQLHATMNRIADISRLAT